MEIVKWADGRRWGMCEKRVRQRSSDGDGRGGSGPGGTESNTGSAARIGGVLLGALLTSFLVGSGNDKGSGRWTPTDFGYGRWLR